MIFLLLQIETAFAGKLADGWHGLPYGSATVLATAPTADCVRIDDATVAWQCHETIGGVPVEVDYMAEEGWFLGVMLKTQGYANCSTLFGVLTVAWTVPFSPKNSYDKSALADGFWNVMRYKTETSAAWTYNRYSDACSASTINAGLSGLVDVAKAKKAAAAAEAL